MIKKILFVGLPIVIFSFLGGFSAQILMSSHPSLASSMVSYFNLGDATNKKGIELYVNDASPAQNFYAADGKIRLQMGTYTAAGERGLPLIAMSDNKGSIKMLFRLAGANESPVIIMKDNQQRDRIVMGLGLNGNDNPFLSIIDENGIKRDIFGTY
jgi:hypothetical protein